VTGAPIMRRVDAGFGILELLIAVAIGSLVIVAIGGLFAVGLEVRDRADLNAGVQATLIELQALAGLAASDIGMIATSASPGGFALVGSIDPNLTVTVRLQTIAASARVELSRGDKTSSVDLSVFEAAAIEYLATSSQPGRWSDAAGVGANQMRGARLRLTSGIRVWRPLLWIESADAPGDP
jgi:hypothetical protein